MSKSNRKSKEADIIDDESTYKIKVNDDVWIVLSSAGGSSSSEPNTPTTPSSVESDAFQLAKVISIDESKQTAVCENTLTKQQETFKLTQLAPSNPLKLDYSVDMASLSHLNEPSVLHNLKLRYNRDDIYTYSGLFLLAVNPYKNLPIYTNDVIKKHAGKRREDVDPHIFSIADISYRQMLLNQKNQSMLVTGESGAGKTESVKKIIQYLATVAGATSHASSGGGNLEQKLLQTNPLLEAFGNARTIRNNNSSRFGKFISIDFGLQGYIVGTKITHYLLETTRVISQANSERNFHFFYQILADAESCKKYKLTSGVNSFHFVNQSGCTHVPGIDDKKEFQDTLNSMRVIGINEDEIDACCRVIAAILHFGNIEFKNNEDELSTLPDRSSMETAAELVNVNPDGLAKGFMKPDIITPTDRIETHVTALQASYNRNALVKSTYNRLFDWLVSRINENLVAKESIKNFIGLLDIAGFEIFENNSFEQLCINFTNEKLQQFFNHHMFKKEQEEYLKEKIEWTFIDFGLDLQPTIDLIEKPLGILSILDQQTFMAQKNEAGLVREITKNHGSKPIYETSKFNELEFTLKHYAGKVIYDTTDWFKRNVDPLNDDCKKTMLQSTIPFVKALYNRPSDREDSSNNKKQQGGTRFKTVSAQYKQQLSELMELLSSTEPHFIRCIKPNNLQKPGIVEDNNVLHQLRCNGVLEGIRISRKGYPGRIFYKDFVRRYALLVEDRTKLAEKNATDREKTKIILDEIEFEETKQYKLGLTKVFLKSSQEAELESLREVQISKIIGVAQAAALAGYERACYRKLQRRLLSIKTIQRNFRGYTKLREWDWWKLLAIVKPLMKEFNSEKQTEKLKQDLADLQEAVKREQEDKKKIELERQKMIQERDIAKEALKAAHTEFEKVVAQAKSLEQSGSDKDQNIRSLKDDAEYKQSTINDLNRTIQNLEEAIKALNEKIHTLEQEVRSRDVQLKQKQTDIQNRENEIELLRKKQKELEGTISELENKLIISGNEVSSRDQKIMLLNCELDDERNRLSSENKSKTQKEDELRKSELSNKKLNQDIEQLTKEVEVLTLDLSKTKVEKTNLIEDTEKKQKVIEDLNRKLESAQQTSRDLQYKLENEQQTLKSTESKGKTLSSDLDSANLRIQSLTEEIQGLEEIVANQKSQISQLTSKIANLEEVELRSRDSKIRELENNLQDQKQKFENEVNLKIQELLRLKQKTDQERLDAEQSQNKLSQEKKDLSENVKNLEKEIKKLQKTIEVANQEKSDVLQKAQKLDSGLNQASDEKEQLQRKLQELDNNIRQLTSEKHRVEFDLQSANEKFNLTSSKLEQVTNELNNEKKRADKLESDLEDLEKEKSSLNDQLTKSKQELENEKSTTLKLKGEQQKLANDIENTKNEKTSLSKDKDELNFELNRLKERLTQVEKEKETETSEKNQAQKKAASLAKEIEKLEQRIRELENVVKTEQSSKSEVEGEAKQKESSLREATEEIERLKTKLTGIQQDLELAKRQADEEVRKSANLRNELKNVELKSKDTSAEKDDLEDEISSLNSQINELNLKLQDAERKTVDEQRNAQQLEEEIEKIRNNASRSREEIENDNRLLKQQMSSLTQQSEGFGRELNDQIQKLKQENLKLKKDLKNAKKDTQPTDAVDSQLVEGLKRKYEIEAANLKSQIDQLGLLKHNLENKNITVEQENLLLKARLETEEKLKKKFQTQKEHAEREIEELRSIAEETEDLRDELIKLRSEYQLTISKLQSELSSEKERYNTLDKVLLQTRKDLDQVKLDLVSERKKLDLGSLSAKQHYELEMANMNQLVQELRKDKVDLVKQEKKTAQKLADLKRDLQEEVSSKQEFEKRASKAEREARLSTLSLQENETRYRRVESEKKRLELEDSMNRDQIKQLENEIDNLRSQLRQEKIKAAAKTDKKKRKNQVKKVLADLEDDLQSGSLKEDDNVEAPVEAEE